jgi:hypothetical protein
VNFDFSQLPPDVPFVFDDRASDNAIHTMMKTIKRYDKDGTLTPRMLGEQMAFCGFGPMPVGTPEMVADVMEKWVNEADIDGFNVACKCQEVLPLRICPHTFADVSNPESYEDVVEMLVPVLQERGLMWKDYAVPGGTFRENMHRRPGEPLLPAAHPAAQFRYDALKAQGKTDEDGHVFIVRRDSVEKVVNGVEGLKI